jgi:hypothetical protein
MDSKKVFAIEVLRKAYDELMDVPLYFAYVYKKPTYDVCADTIRSCVRRYGIQFVVFDNLHFLVRSVSDQVREVSLITQNFKLLAEELGIPIILIARPRKGTNKIITNMDLKDCVTSGTSITLDKGETRIIKTLKDKKVDKYKVKSYNIKTGKVQYVVPEEVLHTGIKKCYKVRLKSGRLIELSENSLVYNGEKWIKICDLKIGDRILVDPKTKPTRKGITMNTGITHFPKGIRVWNEGLTKFDDSRIVSYDHNRVKRKIMKSNFNQTMRAVNPPIGTKYTNHGYILIYQPDWPSSLQKANHLKGYIYEHVYLMEKHLGRSLMENEVIHHIDGDKQNNKLENLLVVTGRGHKLLHWKENEFIHRLIREGKVYFDGKEFNLR